MGNSRSILDPYATEDIIHLPGVKVGTNKRKKLTPSGFSSIYRPSVGDKRTESYISNSSASSVSSVDSSSLLTVPSPLSDDKEQQPNNSQNYSKDKNVNSEQKYIMLEGRRYSNAPENHFYLPCDDEEADRMIMMHFLIKFAFCGNYNAPIQSILQFTPSSQKPVRALDIGCGTGTWVIEMASEFPNAEFHGVDSRDMLSHTRNPSNTHFKQCNYLKGLPYSNNTFDYVRMRLMLAFTPDYQFLYLLKEMHRVLKPLGYVEILDCEYGIHHGGVECAKLAEGIYDRLLKLHGITAIQGQHVSALLMSQPRQGGFIDVHRHKVSIPIGWGSQAGRFHLREFSRHLKSLHPSLKKGVNIEDPKVIEKIGEECIQNHAHMEWFVCYARKAPDLRTLWAPMTEKDAIIAAVRDETVWQAIHELTEGYVD